MVMRFAFLMSCFVFSRVLVYSWIHIWGARKSRSMSRMMKSDEVGVKSDEDHTGLMKSDEDHTWLGDLDEGHAGLMKFGEDHTGLMKSDEDHVWSVKSDEYGDGREDDWL